MKNYLSIIDLLRNALIHYPNPTSYQQSHQKILQPKELLRKSLEIVNNLVFPYITDHRNSNNLLIKTWVWKEPKII